MTLGIALFALFWLSVGLVAYDMVGVCCGQRRWRR